MDNLSAKELAIVEQAFSSVSPNLSPRDRIAALLSALFGHAPSHEEVEAFLGAFPNGGAAITFDHFMDTGMGMDYESGVGATVAAAVEMDSTLEVSY